MFSRNLKIIMEQQGVSQSELSQRTGIGKPSICQYLSGKNIPGVGNLKKIADALNCTVEQLKGEAPKPAITTGANYSPDRNLTVLEVAKRIGKSRKFIYDALQSGQCPFGFGVKGTGDKWTYFIPAQRFENYLKGM